ncbi:MAG: hypothetical protein GX267_02980 [Fibrobacter sp.]|jgi:hypothetical protein|nr:hypothetical protein [Fibrobacter sp.]
MVRWKRGVILQGSGKLSGNEKKKMRQYRYPVQMKSILRRRKGILCRRKAFCADEKVSSADEKVSCADEKLSCAD